MKYYEGTRDEAETLIIINKGDEKDGFFSFGTSRQTHLNRVFRIVPEEEIVDIKRTFEGSRVIWTELKLPVEYLMKSFAIRKPRKLTEEQRKAGAERLAKARERQEKKEK